MIRPAASRPPYGFCDSPETGYPCPICGCDVVWWREPYEKIGEDVYHAVCLERENDYCLEIVQAATASRNCRPYRAALT